MRWTLRIAAILAVLLLAYAIWPVAGFFRIASAIEARDAPALAKLVDFRALRKNLTKQVVAAYMELTGKEQKLGLLGKTFAVGVGTSYAEPIIAQLLNEQTLIDLLTKGKAGDQSIKVPAEFAPFSRQCHEERLADLVGVRIWARRLLRLSAARQTSRQPVQGEAQPHRYAMEACRHRPA